MALGIRRARIRNYKLFRDLFVDFPDSRLLVLVGANGAGKSSLLEALELPLRLARLDPERDGLNNVYYSPLGELFSGAYDPRRVLPAGRRDARLSVRLELEGGEWLEVGTRWLREDEHPPLPEMKWAFSLRSRARLLQALVPPPEERKEEAAEWAARIAAPEGWDLELPSGAEEVKRKERARWPARLAPLLPRAFRLSFQREEAEKPVALRVPGEPRLGPRGEGLAAVLAWYYLTRSPSFGRIEEGLRKVVPQARKLRLELVSTPWLLRDGRLEELGEGGEDSPELPTWLRAGGGPEELVGYRVEVDWEGAGWLPAEQLSEGTLFALCLLVALEQSAGEGEGGLLLLDDIDRGLHPAAQPELLGVLRGVLEERPGLRVLATTHSPFFLDRLEAEEVGVLAFGGEGEVVLRPLSEHPDWPRNAFLSAGEFWTLAGESWAAERGEE